MAHICQQRTTTNILEIQLDCFRNKLNDNNRNDKRYLYTHYQYMKLYLNGIR